MHGPLVRGQKAGQDVQQGRLAAAVLADDAPARLGGDVHVDVVQHGAATTVDTDRGAVQLGPVAGRQNKGGHVLFLREEPHFTPGSGGDASGPSDPTDGRPGTGRAVGDVAALSASCEGGAGGPDQR
ncbi:hypothetical protein GCM10010313_13010 [Streptomyces violarus]|nr:hypothetical protein GCM10010313_13010 [Streptomyces violarus]